MRRKRWKSWESGGALVTNQSFYLKLSLLRSTNLCQVYVWLGRRWSWEQALTIMNKYQTFPKSWEWRDVWKKRVPICEFKKVTLDSPFTQNPNTPMKTLVSRKRLLNKSTNVSFDKQKIPLCNPLPRVEERVNNEAQHRSDRRSRADELKISLQVKCKENHTDRINARPRWLSSVSKRIGSLIAVLPNK